MTEKIKAGKLFHFDNGFWNNPLRCGFLDIYQIGELCCEPGLEIEEHEQVVYEITCVLSGSGMARVDEETIPLKEGQVLINSKGKYIHSLKADAHNLFRYAYIGFDFNFWEDDENLLKLKEKYDEKPYSVAEDRHKIKEFFERSFDELHSPQPLSHRLLTNYCEQIVILAQEGYNPKKDETKNIRAVGVSANSVIYAIIRYIDTNILDLPSIREIADKFGYNYTYLSRTFKQRTGKTLQSHIAYKKTEKALEFLSQGKHTITEIADILGYESVQSFSKAFLKVMGYTPSHYWKNGLEN